MCGSTACSLCCSQCPTCRNSTSTRIMYAIMLMLGTIAACITLSPGLENALKKVRKQDPIIFAILSENRKEPIQFFKLI